MQKTIYLQTQAYIGHIHKICSYGHGSCLLGAFAKLRKGSISFVVSGMSVFVHGQSKAVKHNRFRPREKQVALKLLEGYTRFRPRLIFTFASSSTVPIPVAALCNAWVYGRSLAGIVGSNPAGSMDVCLL
jgi:hypothetical protein